MTRHTTIRIRPGSALERELAAAKARGQGITDYLHELASKEEGRIVGWEEAKDLAFHNQQRDSK